MTYKDAGVDIDLGDTCSQIMYEASKKTWKNRKGKIGEVKETFDYFSGPRFMSIGNLPENAILGTNYDGVGTKTEIAEGLCSSTGDFKYVRGLYQDLFAMLCDDASRWGAEPIHVGSIIDVNKLNTELIENLAEGMVEAANKARVAVVNGEIAELGDKVGGKSEYRCNLNGSCLWIAKKERIISGKEIEVGDEIVALKEKGARSNGISLIRKVMEINFGEKWYEKEYEGRNLGEEALTPSEIYSGVITEITGGYNGERKSEIHGIAHVTGGGIPGKLGRLLKISNYGAVLNDLFEPPDILLITQELGNVDDEEAYRTWCMGQGYLIITPDAEKVRKLAKKYGIESKIVGEITDKPEIEIESRGYFASGKCLTYPIK